VGGGSGVEGSDDEPEHAETSKKANPTVRIVASGNVIR
jgi:hypothetical protein